MLTERGVIAYLGSVSISRFDSNLFRTFEDVAKGKDMGWAMRIFP
jgi:hypothetical protein